MIHSFAVSFCFYLFAEYYWPSFRCFIPQIITTESPLYGTNWKKKNGASSFFQKVLVLIIAKNYQITAVLPLSYAAWIVSNLPKRFLNIVLHQFFSFSRANTYAFPLKNHSICLCFDSTFLCNSCRTYSIPSSYDMYSLWQIHE